MEQEILESINRKLTELRHRAEDASIIRSSFGAIIFSLFVGIFILGNKALINTGNFGELIRNLLFVWGFVFLFSSLITVLLIFLDKLSNQIYFYFDYIMRVVTIVATLISTFENMQTLVQIGGIIGLILIVSLYVYWGSWFFSCQDFIESYRRMNVRSMEIREASLQPH